MNSCCLCNEIGLGREVKQWNRALLQSDRFVVVPSLGALKRGWLLIIPKSHFVSLGALSADLAIELNTLKIRVASMMTAMFGPVCAFEHGPGAAKRSVGCGVDHAHLHMVPIDFDLVAAAQTFLPPGTTWTWATWDNCREATRSGCDYLYIEQPVGNGRIAINPALGSQIFRKAIAAHLGVPEQFNWRDFPQERNILDTITAFADLPISGPGDITHSGRL